MPLGFFLHRPPLELADASTTRFREHSRMTKQDRERAQTLGDLAYELLNRLP